MKPPFALSKTNSVDSWLELEDGGDVVVFRRHGHDAIISVSRVYVPVLEGLFKALQGPDEKDKHEN